MLEELLVRPGGVFEGSSRRDAVVLADKERLQGEQFRIFIRANVASQEEVRIGHHMGVVGIGQACGVEGEQAAGAFEHAAADMFTEGGVALGIDTIDLRAVDEGGDGIELLSGGGDAGGRIKR